MKSFMFHSPTKMFFGAGSLSLLHEQKMPGRKALLVISGGRSVIKNGALERVEKELEQAGCSYVLFNKVCANPTKSIVEEGAETARKENCDFVAALGGGSVMDSAKLIAMLAPQPSHDLWDYAGGFTGKGRKPEKEPLPWIAVTTSAGTGSEVDTSGVVTNPETFEKLGLGGLESLYSRISIVDPELMVTVPPDYTAYQGFDAMFHSTEGYIACVRKPMNAMFERTAIEYIGKYLARAVKDGNDLEAREGVAFANTLSGYAMTLGACISEHIIEHALSAYHPDIPHGAGLIMIAKEYNRCWIRKHVCDEKYVEMARFLGKTEADKPEDFITALAELEEACGVADLKMSDYGIRREELKTMQQNIMEVSGGRFVQDPVPGALTAEDVLEILERSYR